MIYNNNNISRDVHNLFFIFYYLIQSNHYI